MKAVPLLALKPPFLLIVSLNECRKLQMIRTVSRFKNDVCSVAYMDFIKHLGRQLVFHQIHIKMKLPILSLMQPKSNAAAATQEQKHQPFFIPNKKQQSQ